MPALCPLYFNDQVAERFGLSVHELFAQSVQNGSVTNRARTLPKFTLGDEGKPSELSPELIRWRIRLGQRWYQRA
jgi:hypothetical protein